MIIDVLNALKTENSIGSPIKSFGDDKMRKIVIPACRKRESMTIGVLNAFHDDKLDWIPDDTLGNDNKILLFPYVMRS